ncbi:MAG: hypothetical protein WBO68_11170, partial [Pyrinomonadaceae bacterium]
RWGDRKGKDRGGGGRAAHAAIAAKTDTKMRDFVSIFRDVIRDMTFRLTLTDPSNRIIPLKPNENSRIVTLIR